MKNLNTHAAALAAGVLAALAGTAQANTPTFEVLYTFYGDSRGDQFGSSVSGAGDVNGDGYADLIVGARRDDNNGIFSGSARVLSGFDGAELYTFNGDNGRSSTDPFGDSFGSSVSGAGDVNGDGYADLIVGAPRDDNNGDRSGSARVLSGFDGAELFTFNGDSRGDQFGISVSGAGDVNGDGYADLIVGAWGDDNKSIDPVHDIDSGSARVLSGIDGAELFTFSGDSAYEYFGHSVSGAGDVNGDGFADFIVGAFGNGNNGIFSGSAFLYSGIDGGLLGVFDGLALDDGFGYSVSGAGDVNGDGIDDFIVGAERGGANGGGYAVVYAGIPAPGAAGLAAIAGLAAARRRRA